MSFAWWGILLLSVGLVGIGAFLLIRDFQTVRARPAGALVSGNEPMPALDAALRPAPPPAAPEGVRVVPPPLAPPPAGASAAPLPAPASPHRLPAVETHWSRLRPEVDRAVSAVNETMASMGVAVARPGEPTWSLHDRGFGDYRRIRVGGESIAWLRLELAADMTIGAHLRTHEARNEQLNRSSVVTRPLSAGRIATALAECLAALLEAAPRLLPHPPQAIVAPPAARDGLTPPTQPIPPAAASPSPRTGRGPGWPQWLNRPEPITGNRSKTAASRPHAVATLIDNAIILVNAAFAEAGARLVPASAAMAGGSLGPSSRALSIDVEGTSVGLMLIDPAADRIDIAVGVPDLSQFGAARRQTQAVAGLTVHPLAETIATCAWPAIAAAKAAVDQRL